jgi:nitrogen fixation NifU-like protein
MLDDLYQEVILEEYAHPKNKHPLTTCDVHVADRNSSCGDEIEVFLKFDQQQKVTDVGWQGVGCAISMAAASVLSEFLKGKSKSEIVALKKADLESLVGIEEIAFGREKCLLLSLNAFQKAVSETKDSAQ